MRESDYPLATRTGEKLPWERPSYGRSSDMILDRIPIRICRVCKDRTFLDYVARPLIEYVVTAALKNCAGAHASVGADSQIGHDLAFPMISDSLDWIVVRRKERLWSVPFFVVVICDCWRGTEQSKRTQH